MYKFAETALRYFDGPEGYNCAQAIATAFAAEFNVPPERIAAYAASGNGRAEGGRCGALHAARQLLGDAPAAEAVEQRFVQAAGSAKCREIRRGKRLTCAGCVEAVARLLEKHLAERKGSPEWRQKRNGPPP